MMIHHALWIETPADEEKEVGLLMRRRMTSAVKLWITLEVDID
jgi:DNA polymerase I-like protein with 3'-5' exonuclease and polymerase domains